MQRVEGRPQVVAHRGASRDRPEHTLDAYTAALDAGADALECDVRLTADGHLVCVHDRRVDRTTNGRGVVSTMELADITRLDASRALPDPDLDPDWVPEMERDGDALRVLTLSRLIEAVRDYDRPVDLAVETKHPTRFAGLVERRLVELLDSVGWAGPRSPVRVMSFSAVALTRVKRLAPDLEVVLLIDREHSWQVSTSVLDEGWIAGPGIDLLRESPRLGRRLRRSGRRIHVWTVNEEADLDLCLRLGVEALITDDPRWALDRLAVADGSGPGPSGGV
jgi:glycerophosphoryl diester phosphodiesterase